MKQIKVNGKTMNSNITELIEKIREFVSDHSNCSIQELKPFLNTLEKDLSAESIPNKDK